MLVAFLTAFYMFRVVFLAFFGSAGRVHGAREQPRRHASHDASWRRTSHTSRR